MASAVVGEGIRRLVAAGRLTAVSYLSGAPAWREESYSLKQMRNRIDVGLHFNLTLELARTQIKELANWIEKSLTGRIDQVRIKSELARELDLFESAWGAPPDFVHGHQHIHIFPGVRQVFLHTLAERYPGSQRPWIRQVNPRLTGHDALFKALILRILSRGFYREAQRAGSKMPSGFSGLYSFSLKSDYPAMIENWLRRARPNDLLMCHPRAAGDNDPDGIGDARV